MTGEGVAFDDESRGDDEIGEVGAGVRTVVDKEVLS